MLGDAVLAVLTAMAVAVLLSSRESVTRSPRVTMATFLAVYATVEAGRVAVYAATGRMPSQAAPGLEVASGFVYVVSCAALPLAYIWMMNARLHADLLRQATTDPLTGLLNRRALEAACVRMLGAGGPMALALLDLDHFKHVNDEMGHPAGDEALAEAAAFLAAEAGPGETAGRLGGEEFLLLIPAAREEAHARAEEIRSGLAGRDLRVDGRRLRLTCSIGIAFRGAGAEANWAQLLRQADQALYAAKRAGRNRCEEYTESAKATALD